MLVSEIAKLAGLSKDGIRHYEELGLIESSPRQAGSRTYRDYDPSILKTIENIRGLQGLGLSLQEIKPILKIVAAGPTKEQAMEFVEDRLKSIREKNAQLTVTEQYLALKLKRFKETRIITELNGTIRAPALARQRVRQP
jgi:MerR family copper efflux transcriptional regulator